MLQSVVNTCKRMLTPVSSRWWFPLFGPLALFYVVFMLLPGDVVVHLFVAPRTVLWLVASVLWLLWPRKGVFKRSVAVGEGWKGHGAFEARKLEAKEEGSALHALMSDLFRCYAAMLDANVVFWLNDYLRRNNPFGSVFSEPVVTGTLGSVPPTLMHFRRRPDQGIFHIYACDLVYDGDAKVRVEALQSVVVRIAKFKVAATMLFRFCVATGEVHAAIEGEPMVNVAIKATAFSSGFAPEILQAACLNVLADAVDTLKVPHWQLIFQAKPDMRALLSRMDGLASYSRPASLAVKTALERMQRDAPVESQQQAALDADDFVMVAESSNGGISGDGCEPSEDGISGSAVRQIRMDDDGAGSAHSNLPGNSEPASQLRPPPPSAPKKKPTRPNAVVPVGSPVLVGSGIVYSDSNENVYYVPELDDRRKIPVAQGRPFEQHRGLVACRDEYGVGVAFFSQDSIILATKRKNAPHFSWKESGGEGESLVHAMVETTGLWHIIVLRAKGSIESVVCHPWARASIEKRHALPVGNTSDGSVLSASACGAQHLAVACSSGVIVVLHLTEGSVFNPVARTSPIKLYQQLHASFSCCWLRDTRDIKDFCVAAIHSSHLFVDGEDVTLRLREQGCALNDCIGRPTVVSLRGEAYVFYRCILGQVNCVHGSAKEWKHVNLTVVKNLPDVVAWDVAAYGGSGFSALKVVWCSADGNVHRLAGTSLTTLMHAKFSV